MDSDLVGQCTDSSGTDNVVIVEEDKAASAKVGWLKVYIPRSLASNGRLLARIGGAIKALRRSGIIIRT